MTFAPSRIWLLLVCLFTSHLARGNEFFAMDTIAKGDPAAVASMLRELGYDGLGGTALDSTTPAVITRAGLKFYNAYYVIRFAQGKPALDAKLQAWLDQMQGAETVLWLAIEAVSVEESKPLPLSSTEGDALAIAELTKIADYAKARGTKVSLYPHTGYWLARFEDAMRITNQLNRPDVGLTFNLCHWLKVEGSERDPLPLIQKALPRLMFVTINGADAGDTRAMGWEKLIQPLGSGSYDVGQFVRAVRKAGYTRPFGFQGYGIPGDARSVLQRTMAAWRAMTSSSQ